MSGHEAKSTARDLLATTGYTLVLPPGWAKIPLRSGTEGAIKLIVDRASAGVSRDEAARARRELTVRLREQADAARHQAGLDLYLPTERVHGFSLPVSFVVAEVEFGSVDPVDPVTLVLQVASDSASAEACEVDGVPAARNTSIAPPDPKLGDGGSRRVDYAMAVPGEPDRWLLISCSTTPPGGAEDELAELCLELFDAIMSTFRWTTGAAEHASREAVAS